MPEVKFFGILLFGTVPVSFPGGLIRKRSVKKGHIMLALRRKGQLGSAGIAILAGFAALAATTGVVSVAPSLSSLVGKVTRADAGPDQSITLPQRQATLTGRLPSRTPVWVIVSGPSGARIVSPASLTTAVTFPGAGVWTFELRTRGTRTSTSTDRVTVTVKAEGASTVVASNAAPAVPASTIAPWLVQQRINALSFSSRNQMTTVWGDYWESSEDPTYVFDGQQSQELGNAANGASATYSGLDLGDGVEAMMLRVSAPDSSTQVQIRMDSASGPLAGPLCSIASTGAVGSYRTVRCALDPSVARGRDRSLVFVFLGTNPATRFNWFGFWARGTVQQIDTLTKAQRPGDLNPATPSTPQAGTPTRTPALLPASSMPLARTYGRWEPSQVGDCPKWLHDTYWVPGDDGKAYPTWHPAVDYNRETGAYCTFGHEHGSDPKGSTVFNVGGLPAFGYVSENHEPNAPSLQRIEDHVGYKVIVANAFTMYNGNNPSQSKRCSLLTTLHVGTHSPDAFVNTAHEVQAAGQCEGLEPFSLRYFTLFGAPGSFKEAEAEGCNQGVSPGVAPSPANQPTGGVHRAIPTAACFLRGTADDQSRLVRNRLIEFWLTGLTGGNFYYTIGNPSRFYAPDQPQQLGRVVDLCYQPNHPLAATLQCQETVASSPARIAYIDPRSSFRGSVHVNTHFSTLAFGNAPSSTMYTNAWGQNASPTPDPSRGIIFKQTVPTVGFNYKADGQASRVPNVDHSSGGRNGVRSPN